LEHDLHDAGLGGHGGEGLPHCRGPEPAAPDHGDLHGRTAPDVALSTARSHASSKRGASTPVTTRRGGAPSLRSIHSRPSRSSTAVGISSTVTPSHPAATAQARGSYWKFSRSSGSPGQARPSSVRPLSLAWAWAWSARSEPS